MAGIIAYPASAAGVATRVLEAGSGSDIVFFLHGVGARADRWRNNLAVVAEAGYRCLAVDLPGHGFARKGVGFPYGVPGYADFIAAFLKEHGIEKAHLVGTSLGAHILGNVLCRNPDLALSFTMVGATGMFPIGGETRERIATRIVDTSLGGMKNKLLTVIHDPAKVDDLLIDEEWKINTSPGASEAFAALAEYFRQRLDDDVVGGKLADLGNRQRRLLIWGEDDRSVPLEVGRKIEELLGVKLVPIPRTAHAPYWEDPARFNTILLEFLKSVG